MGTIWEMKRYDEDRDPDDYAIVVKDWACAPIFTVSKTQNEVTIAGRTWTTGVLPPHQEELGRTEALVKGLNIEHARVILALMSFQQIHSENQVLTFSMKRLCELTYGYYNKQYYAKAKRLLSELIECWVSVYCPEGFKDDPDEQMHYFRIIESASIMAKSSKRGGGQQELFFDNVRIDRTYLELMQKITDHLCIDVKMLSQITGDLAQAIYMYLPSRTAHEVYTKNNPFKIKLTKLFDQVGYSTTKTKYKSKRKEVMDRGVLEQLNETSVMGGKFFCDLRESKDKSDWMLCCWTEKVKKAVTDGKNKTEIFFKSELKFSDQDWAILINEANQFDSSQYKYWPQFTEDENIAKWQYQIYATAITNNSPGMSGAFALYDLLGSESDSESGHGAMILKLRSLTAQFIKK